MTTIGDECPSCGSAEHGVRATSPFSGICRDAWHGPAARCKHCNGEVLLDEINWEPGAYVHIDTGFMQCANTGNAPTFAEPSS